MTQMFASPGRYIQGYKELEKIYQYIKWFGKSLVVVTSKGRKESLQAELEKSFKGTGVKLEYVVFNGEVTRQEISRVVSVIKETESDGVIALGGGKVLDVAKAAANEVKMPICIVPTIVSNDAPTSALSVIYREDGSQEDVIFFERSPDVVLVDTDIIARGPSRLLVAGMGDALSTYFEARTCVNAYRDNFLGIAGGGMGGDGSAGTKATKTSMAIAELCYEVLLECGVQAKMACDNNVVTKALNRIVEANSLMSGIGFESNGVSTAHAVYGGFSELSGREHMFHGEYVAFGTIVMLVLEGADKDEIEEVVEFCISVGLPVTFEDLKVDDITDEELDTIAGGACAPAQTSHTEPFLIEFHEMRAAILTAEKIGRDYKNGLAGL